MSKKIMGITVCIGLIFTLMFTFTNCMPIHESVGSGELPSLSSCENVYVEFYKTSIREFNDVQAGSSSCADCHSAGGIGNPQFLESFTNFISLSSGTTFIPDQVEAATNKILNNATIGGTSFHPGGGLSSSEADQVSTVLQQVDAAYEICLEEQEPL